MDPAATAEDFFTDIFKRYLANWNVVISLRQVASVALPLAHSQLASLHKEQMAYIAEHPMAQRLIVEKDGTHSPLSPDLQRFISQGATDTALKNADAAIDAASLVFGHSIIDDCALAYCRVCALAKPDDWAITFEKRTVTFQTLMSKTKDEIRMDMIEARLKELERGPLLAKIKTLLSLFKPAKDYGPIGGYTFDEKRIEEIDTKRHRIIHESAFGRTLVGVEQDLEYLQQTVHFMLALVNQHYGIRISEYRLRMSALKDSAGL
jgi:hypothetical protein